MFCIVGLGNPGEEYSLTRHNVGWLALAAFLEQTSLPGLVESGTYTARLSEGVVDGVSVGVVLPTTYMNKSGSSVQRYMKTHNLTPDALIVVHDDVDLPFGTLRISLGRGGGGHNGVQSIIDTLGTADFIRVRIGVAKTGLFGRAKRPRGDALADFVLGVFTPKEQKALPQVSERAADALRMILTHGATQAMNKVNA